MMFLKLIGSCFRTLAVIVVLDCLPAAAKYNSRPEYFVHGKM